MVRIEKLEMQGFKSFAKKTLITLPSNFSVICGPNGSGKSNSADAICFVLGRSSAKSLRADRMLEVIYNGGKGKQPADFAKVTIYFDNSDKKFPIEESVVSVSRKVNRKGISIYKLNGRTVTREKILEVLYAANIQPDGHNIILQGDVTEVIEMSPLERREIIDEISGIAEYDEKRIKAQRELLTVAERLKESSIVLNERASLIEKLRQESKAAEEYKFLSRELDKLRASLAGKRLKEAEDAMTLLTKKIDEKEKSAETIDKEFEEAESALESREKFLDDTGKKFFDRSKDIAVIKEIEKIRSEILRKKDRAVSAQAEAQRLGSVIERLKTLHLQTPQNKAVQEVLKLGKTGVYGTIASLLSVAEQFAVAIEVAAGPHMYDIVTADTETAVECINFLKRNKIGRATFLPLDKIKPKPQENVKKYSASSASGVFDFAINLIKFDKKYYNALSFVLGNTLVVDKIETAKRIGVGKTRFATLDGDLVERSGAMIGGFYYKQERFAVNEIGKYESARQQLRQEAESLAGDIEKLEMHLKQLVTEEEHSSGELSALEKEREKIVQDLESERTKRKELYEKRLTIQNELNRLKIHRAKLEAELENIKIEFGNYKDVETYDHEPSILETKLRETILAINKLGAINMKAVEEYSQQRAVYEELKSKVDKLTEERDRIFQIMAEIESKRKGTFFKTLSAIAEQFKQVFHDLMEGDATLYLEEQENLESGLIIEASPAGRKLLNIDAMSGGETTLTALAFLFAIQRFRPAPFYILDEIDAALDKSNTKKAVELIKKYSANSQFIVITHNDTTIATADCVYGVSMQDGESKLVGIRMPEFTGN